MTIYIFIGILAVGLLASVGASIFAIWWSHRSARFVPALILSLVALAIAYYWLGHFHFTQKTTVNGQVTRDFDSKWFFIASLLLGGFALAYTLWKKVRSGQRVVS